MSVLVGAEDQPHLLIQVALVVLGGEDGLPMVALRLMAAPDFLDKVMQEEQE
jgi:hypothetical protein